LCVEVESTEGILFTKVKAEVAAAWVACLPIETIEVLFVVEIAEAVFNILVAEILVVGWEVFCG
jgi:hypothetical protein